MPSINLNLGLSPRVATLLKRGTIAFVFLAFLVYLVPRDRSPSMWFNRYDTQLAQKYQEGLDVEIKNTDWGLQGKRVKQMSEWAQEYMNLQARNPYLNGKPMTEALFARYPWLKGADGMYIPWDTKRREAVHGYSETGITVCTGSRNYNLAAHLITTLRNVLNSTIPIEVAFAGDDDLKPEHRDFLQSLGSDVHMLNLLDFFPSAKNDLVNSGWAMKPFSMLASRSKKVMVVDADALFLLRPDDIFQEHPGLMGSGVLVYHDRAAMGSGDEGITFLKQVIEQAGKEPSRYLKEDSLYYIQESWYEADSGMVAMDKTRPEVFMGLVFVCWLNTKDVRDPVSYVKFYGDKETFWIAMELSSVEYFFNPWYAGTLGKATNGLPENPDETATEICGTHMLHMDHTGTKPFWINGGIYQHKSMREQGYAILTHWWRGNSDVKTKPKWWWQKGNVACLSEKGVKAMDPDQMNTVVNMISAARDIDEQIKAKFGG